MPSPLMPIATSRSCAGRAAHPLPLVAVDSLPHSSGAVFGSFAKSSMVGLLMLGLLTLSGCGGGGGGDGAETPQPPAPTRVTPAATVANNGRLTIEHQDRASAAGAQVSQSPRFTLVNEGVSP